MRRYLALLALPLFASACQGSASNIPMTASFSKPDATQLDGPPKKTWIFASNSFSANVDVYNAATMKMISTCPCTGMGLAVDPTTNDLAVGSRAGTVTVWHVSGKAITQFATLQLSQGPYAIGLAYDSKGDLYAGNVGQNVVDFFTASEIGGGGGSPTRSVSTSNLVDIYYLAATGDRLLADGYDVNGLPIMVSVNLKAGGDTVLQQLSKYNSLAEGIAVDTHGHLIVNSAGNSNELLVFDKPWTGSPASTFPYGSGGNAYYTAISLNKRQDTIWAGNYFLKSRSQADTNLQANSYPLGSLGGSTSPVAMEYYDSVAVDPQAK